MSSSARRQLRSHTRAAAAEQAADPLAASPFRHLQNTALDDVRPALRLVVDALDQDDCFAFALTCTPFRAATCLKKGPFARFPEGLKT